MITLKQWMETVNYRITEGDAWTSESFGHNAHYLSAWNGVHGKGGWSLNIVFDTETQLVYQVEVCDYTNDRAYRMIHPDYRDAVAEAANGNEYLNQAWDDVDFTDLEVDEDWLDKAMAVVEGKEYDTGISVPLDFTDEELLKYMIMAHERNITFNSFVEEALKSAIEEHKRDPEAFKARAKEWQNK